MAKIGEIDGCKAACMDNPLCEAIVATTHIVDWESPHDYMCGIRARIDKAMCVDDGHHDTYYLANPLRAPRLPTGILDRGG